MTLFILEQVKPGLRGELSRWMLEVKAGVFVGQLSARIRELLWQRITVSVKEGQATLDHYLGAWMIHDAPNEQGFQLESVGETQRELRDFDGLRLIVVRK